jgi:hypothetical protein
MMTLAKMCEQIQGSFFCYGEVSKVLLRYAEERLLIGIFGYCAVVIACTLSGLFKNYCILNH